MVRIMVYELRNKMKAELLNQLKDLYLGTFMFELLKIGSEDPDGRLMGEEDITERILTLGHCKDQRPAMMTAKTIIFLVLLDQTEIHASYQSAFDVVYFLMEERLSYSSAEKNMVLLPHEVEIEYPDNKITEKHRATLLEFGKTLDGKTTTAMAVTVGISAAVRSSSALTDKQNSDKRRVKIEGGDVFSLFILEHWIFPRDIVCNAHFWS